jgi:hypothetical protein
MERTLRTGEGRSGIRRGQEGLVNQSLGADQAVLRAKD